MDRGEIVKDVEIQRVRIPVSLISGQPQASSVREQAGWGAPKETDEKTQ